MKISYSWLHELIDLSAIGSPEKVAAVLTARGLEVEEIQSQGKGLEKVVTAKIVKKDPHPQSDRLSYCEVDVGTGKNLFIVCGATNHKQGDIVAASLVGAELPNGLKIGRSKIRGVESEGMLCSESELGMAKESEGILILPPSTPIGKPIAEILGLSDTILTLKLYANQGHFLSHIGVAREIAAHLGKKFEDARKLYQGDVKPGKFKVDLQAGADAPQFHAVEIEGVKIGPSSPEVVKRLEAIGARSINNVVDATNLVLFETGQPVHAYDADRLDGSMIGVRIAKSGEKLPLLDGTEVECTGDELVIVDGKKAVGLAGVMGGGNSEVSDSTTRLLLEVAEFSSAKVRKTKVRHQKHSEAAARFEKGIDPANNERVMRRLIELVTSSAGGKVTGGSHVKAVDTAKRTAITLPFDYCTNYLGFDVSKDKVASILRGLECDVVETSGAFSITPPSYRHDLNIKQDLTEEVARTIGYDAIPSTVPVLSSAPQARSSADFIFLNRAKEAFVRQGLSETINYSFRSKSELELLGMKSTAKLLNPLSEAYEFLVPSLIPGLLENLRESTRKHFGSDALALPIFEIRPTFHHPENAPIEVKSNSDTGVTEQWKVAFLLSGPESSVRLSSEDRLYDFYDAKGVVTGFFEQLGTKGLRMLGLDQSRSKSALHANLHPGQSAILLLGNQEIGAFGRLHPKIEKAEKFKSPVWIGEWDFEALKKMSRGSYAAKTFEPWADTPPIERDFAFLLDGSVKADAVIAAIQKAGKPLLKSARVFDRYQGGQVAAGKVSLAFRTLFRDDTRALTDAEVEPLSAAIIAAVTKEFGAELR